MLEGMAGFAEQPCFALATLYLQISKLNSVTSVFFC